MPNKGFTINKNVMKNLERELNKEFSRLNVKVPVQVDTTHK